MTMPTFTDDFTQFNPSLRGGFFESNLSIFVDNHVHHVLGDFFSCVGNSPCGSNLGHGSSILLSFVTNITLPTHLLIDLYRSVSISLLISLLLVDEVTRFTCVT